MSSEKNSMQYPYARAKGARALIEVGFEKVDEFDGKHLYYKRK